MGRVQIFGAARCRWSKGGMKEGRGEEHIGRIRKFLKSNLNAVNTMSAVNSCAVVAIRYSAGVIMWTKEELQNLDRKTRKLLTIYRAFYPKGDKDSLYLSRINGATEVIRAKARPQHRELRALLFTNSVWVL